MNIRLATAVVLAIAGLSIVALNLNNRETDSNPAPLQNADDIVGVAASALDPDAPEQFERRDRAAQQELPEDVAADVGNEQHVDLAHSIPSEEPIATPEATPLESSAQVVARYFARLPKTDANVNALVDYARSMPDNATWSDPVRKLLSEILKESESKEFDAGDIFVECGGELCFILGDMDWDSVSALTKGVSETVRNGDPLGIAVGRAWKSDEYGWAAFYLSPNFVVPSGS